jgi:hypothetical protein
MTKQASHYIRAIQDCLRARKRAATRRTIVAHAAEVAGTELDLDQRLDAAAVESLLKAALELK